MKELSVKRQVEIMEAQLSSFASILEKAQYLTMFFDQDPSFSKEARDIVRANLCKPATKQVNP